MSGPTPELPDKLYFKIGEVAKLVGVKPYVLRYWETEFPSIRPGKTRSQHRLYRRRDVEMLLEIRRLLHDERYTIEGAKRRLRGGRGAEVELADPRVDPEVPERRDRDADRQMDLPLGNERAREALAVVRRELEQIRDLLAGTREEG
jgi:DNA-binding transcriptional MerR regulator